LLLLAEDQGDAAFKGILDVTYIDRINRDACFIGLVFVKFSRNVLLGLHWISKHLSANAVEGLQEGLRVEILSRAKERIDIPRDQVQQWFHPILVMQAYLLLICLHLTQKLLLLCVVETVYEIKCIVPGLKDHLWDLLAFAVDDLDYQILSKMLRYYSWFFLFEGGNASSNAVLHLAVGSAYVLVVRGGSLLDMSFSVGADTGCAKTDVALLYLAIDVPLQQKLEMSSFGCRSQKVRLKSIIFD
jgi:hypothetical protein